MKYPHPVRATLLAALLLLLAGGCRFGEARFDGALGERAFDPGGTVFSYVDERDDNLLERATQPVVVSMVWITFDPESDLNDLSGAELEDYKQELRLRDALALVFADKNDVTTGADFESLSQGGSELGDDGLRARLHLAPERLSRSSTYADFKPYGSRRQVNVSLTEVRLVENGPIVAGDVTIDVARGENDAGEVLEGTLVGAFRAPIVSERTAERNLSLLAVDDVLGLPLEGDDGGGQ